MNVTIKTRAIQLSSQEEEALVHNITRALSRHERVIHVVAVCEDVNGPRGGVDKYCRLTAQGPGLGMVVVEERDTVLGRAVDRAAQRLTRAVVRSLGRRRRRRQAFHRGLAPVEQFRAGGMP